MRRYIQLSMAAGYELDVKVGRLIEARVFRLMSIEEANAYSRALGARVAAFPAGERPILCADHRPVVIYPQAVADRLTELFVHMNTRLERIAILVARSNATLALQLNRIVREAGYENRRVFYESPGAVEHLGSVLDAAEKSRVRDFLDELIAR